MFIILCNPFIVYAVINVGVWENENSLTVKISTRIQTWQEAKKITFKTFKKWAFKEDFTAERDEQGYVMSLVGKSLLL